MRTAADSALGAAWRVGEAIRTRLLRAAETNVGIVVLLPALASIAVGATPGADFWQDGLGRWISVGGPVLTALGVAVLAQAHRVERAARDRYHARSRLCQRIALRVAEEVDPGLPPLSAVGVHVWEPRGAGNARYLELVTTYGLDQRLTVGVTFGPGKGVVGNCWSERAEQFLDNEKERALADELGAEVFDARREREPRSLPYAEFSEFAYYNAFYADRFLNGDSRKPDFAGCVSIDARSPVSAEDLRSVVCRGQRSPDLRALISDLQETFLGKP